MNEDNPYLTSGSHHLWNRHTGTLSEFYASCGLAEGAGEGATSVSTLTISGLGRPTGLFVDADGAILASVGQTICKCEPGAHTSARVIAGFPEGTGFRDGEAGEARFISLQGITKDKAGRILVIDSGNNAVRVLQNNQVKTLAGNCWPDFVNASGPDARFDTPLGLAVDVDGSILVADYKNHAIRRVAMDGTVSTVAGNGKPGFVDASGENARFDGPAGLALDVDGSILVADCFNHAIRRVARNGMVSTVAGDGKEGFTNGEGAAARFSHPASVLVVSQDAIIVADAGNNCLRRIRGRHVTTLAGDSEEGSADGIGLHARFRCPNRLALYRGNSLLVAEGRRQDTLRLVDMGTPDRVRPQAHCHTRYM